MPHSPKGKKPTPTQQCYGDHTKIIDIAAMGHMLNPMELKESAHVVELDDIEISSLLFRRIFYAYDGESFNLDCNVCRSKEKGDFRPYLSFESLHRSVNGIPFNLAQTVFGHIETDLGVPRECLDLTCKIELEKELAHIMTICDINSCSVLTALKWSEVLKVLQSQGAMLKGVDDRGENIPHVLKISIVFKNPNRDIKDTIVKFRYLIADIRFNI